MSVADRGAARRALGSALSAALTGAQAVYTAQPTAFDGLSPVVVIASSGADREGRSRRTFAGPVAPLFFIDVYVFVVTVIKDENGNDVLNQGADDQLDAIEAALAQFVAQNPKSATWSAIGYDGKTTTEFVTVLDGTEYKREKIPLVLTSTP